MGSAWEDLPSKPEKARQIHLILASKGFVKKPTLARLLNRIVQSDLDGKPVDERRLGVDVFGKDEDWITLNDAIVRENVRLLRIELEKYYRTHGSEDRVTIHIHAYTAVFSYSHQSPAYRRCRLGYRLLAKGDPMRAEIFFKQAIGADPNHAPAYAGLADCQLLICVLFGYHAHSDTAVYAEELANRALRLNPELWQAHVALGALFSFRRQWEDAIGAFDRAKEINAPETEESPWYLMFLYAMGLGDSGLRIARSKVLANVEDPAANAVLALCLYMRGQFMEAGRALTRFEFVERPDSLALICGACLKLALGNCKEAVMLIEEIDVIVRNFPLVRGLLALSLASSNRKGQARKALDRLNRSKRSSLALALAQMGLGEGPDAVATLRKACKNCEPTMILVHAIPALAPLASLKSFRSLIKSYQPFGKRH